MTKSQETEETTVVEPDPSYAEQQAALSEAGAKPPVEEETESGEE